MVTNKLWERIVGAVYTPACVIVPQFPQPGPPTVQRTEVFAGPTTVAENSCGGAPAFNWSGPGGEMLTVVPPEPCDAPGMMVIVTEPVLEKSVTDAAVIVTRKGLETTPGAV